MRWLACDDGSMVNLYYVRSMRITKGYTTPYVIELNDGYQIFEYKRFSMEADAKKYLDRMIDELRNGWEWMDKTNKDEEKE